MAEKTLKTRIMLKYDTLNNWNNSNLILKAGEIAFCDILNGQGTIPKILYKVGDGVHTFSELDYGNNTLNYNLDANNHQISNVTSPTLDQDAATKKYVDDAVGAVVSIRFEVVQVLPQEGENGVIYLISNSGSGSNIYDEYIWVNNNYEKIGTTDIDLSGYLKKDGSAAMTGALDMGTHEIRNVADPTNAQDAATKKYVDSAIDGLDGSAEATAAVGNVYTVLTSVTQTNGSIAKGGEVTLSAIAKTGNVNDLIQNQGDVLVLDCGSV